MPITKFLYSKEPAKRNNWFG